LKENVKCDIIYNYITSSEIKIPKKQFYHTIVSKKGTKIGSNHINYNISGSVSNLFFKNLSNENTFKIYLNNFLICSDNQFLTIVRNTMYQKEDNTIVKIPFCLNGSLSDLIPNGTLQFNKDTNIDCHFEFPVEENQFLCYYSKYYFA
jgi:hypothetical protein